MAAESLRALRLWTRIAVGATCISFATHIAYAVLCEIAAHHFSPALMKLRTSADVAQSCAAAGYVGAAHNIETFKPIALAVNLGWLAVFVVWSRLAFAAAAVVAPRGTKLASPFEIMGMWLVPIIHLFMPFWYTRDLLRACDPSDLTPVEVQTMPTRGYRRPGVETRDAWRRPWMPFRLWWALWVVALSGYVVARVVFPRLWVDAEGVRMTFHLEVARALLGLGSLVTFLAIVRGTTEIIVERARRLKAMRKI